MHTLKHFHQNHLLESLRDAGCKDLDSHIEFVPLKSGEVLCEAEEKMVHVYFPTTSVVSMISQLEEGASDEVAFVGNDGIIGIPLFLGAETSSHRVVVRSTGYAIRLDGKLLMEKFHESVVVQKLLLRYTHALLGQISQSLVCNRHHSIHQQFCRWLLNSIDRMPSNEVSLTHESIAGMLGVRRESITKEAGELQAAGLIRNRRGRITVLDRPKLEARACHCYREASLPFGGVLRQINGCHDAGRFAPGKYMPLPRVAAKTNSPVVAA